jgi:hypothetical protein
VILPSEVYEQNTLSSRPNVDQCTWTCIGPCLRLGTFPQGVFLRVHLSKNTKTNVGPVLRHCWTVKFLFGGYLFKNSRCTKQLVRRQHTLSDYNINDTNNFSTDNNQRWSTHIDYDNNCQCQRVQQSRNNMLLPAQEEAIIIATVSAMTHMAD